MSIVVNTKAEVRPNFLESEVGLVLKTREIPASMGVQDGKYKIVKAGTPVPSDNSNAVGIVFEDIQDVKSMMDRRGALADKMSPTMRFLVSVCVSREYGEKVKFALSRLASRYPYYTEKIAAVLDCTPAEVEPFVHLSILALNNYMIFAERALFTPQIEAAKRELLRLAERKGEKHSGLLDEGRA